MQRFDGFWHYGVALSDTQAISWGPCEEAKPYYTGRLRVHPLGSEFKDAVSVAYIDKAEIFKNVMASVPAFHHKWNYGLQGWNCEHWARLVVSEQPISYQVKDQLFGMFDLFGVLHCRGEAIAHLNQYK